MVPVRGVNVSASAGFDNAKITSVPAGAQGFSVGQTLSCLPRDSWFPRWSPNRESPSRACAGADRGSAVSVLA
jgi:hypothetical protein